MLEEYFEQWNDFMDNALAAEVRSIVDRGVQLVEDEIGIY